MQRLIPVNAVSGVGQSAGRAAEPSGEVSLLAGAARGCQWSPGPDPGPGPGPGPGAHG